MSSPQESRSHAYTKGSFPTHEWLSPASTISTSSESMSSYPDTPYQQLSHHHPHPGYYGNDSYLAHHQSTDMWRTASTGTALSHSINSLALADPPKSGFFPVQHFDSDMSFSGHHYIKSEPESDFSLHGLHANRALLSAPAMVSSASLPGYGSDSIERRLKMQDIEAMASSPDTPSDNNSSAQAAKRGAKRKELGELTNLSLGSPLSGKLKKAGSIKASEQRRPPPSASQITEAGKPFPTIDTSAKHSSLFVAPDTSGLTKKEARLVKNRAAAFLSRQRKREQFEEMEMKCKSISMLVWRMWGLIAGPDATADQLSGTPLSALLANEEPGVQAILEEVIAKQGASVAPTVDVDGNDIFGDRSQSPATQPFATPSYQQQQPMVVKSAGMSATKELQDARDEISRLRSSLASSIEREKVLLVDLDTVRTSNGSQFSESLSQPSHTSDDWLAPPTQVPSQIPTRPFLPHSMSMPFRGSKAAAADISLYTSDSPPASFGFGQNYAHASGLLGPAPIGESTFDIGRTPTLSMFSDSDATTQGRTGVIKSQPLYRSDGLGLDYAAVMLPGRANNPVHVMALMLVVAGLSVMTGLGGAAQLAHSSAEPNRAAAAAGNPSSHLSEDDLHLDFFHNHAATAADLAEHQPPPPPRPLRNFRRRIALTRTMSNF